MIRKKRHLFFDAVLLAFSVAFAVYITATGAVHNILALFPGTYVGIFMAGMFFTSAFTTAPAIIVLAKMSERAELIPLALVGGLGAVIGDYVLFKFMKDRVSQDLEFILRSHRRKRFSLIFKTKLFHFFVPLLGALVIASPLPDELGVAMLGISKTKDRVFVLISYVMNAAGIFAIGALAQILLAA